MNRVSNRVSVHTTCCQLQTQAQAAQLLARLTLRNAEAFDAGGGSWCPPSAPCVNAPCTPRRRRVTCACSVTPWANSSKRNPPRHPHQSKRELPTPAHASSTCVPRDIQKRPNRSQCHNPLRQAVMIAAAFAGSLVLFHQFSAHP